MVHLARKVFDWLFYRMSIRWPKLLARLSNELPTRPVASLFSKAPKWERRIPNVVYQTWVEPFLGRTHCVALAAFRELNSDFTFEFFSDADADAFMSDFYSDHPILEVYKNGLFGPLKADIFRYCLLFHYGGVYCDIGKAVRKPLRELIPSEASAVITWERRNSSPFPVSETAKAVLQHPDRRILNWALMFAPRHLLLKRVIDGIVEHYPAFRAVPVPLPKESILEFTGPLWLTKCVLAAAEAGELDGIVQAGIEFDGSAEWNLPGSYVRYVGRKAYILARDQPIVS